MQSIHANNEAFQLERNICYNQSKNEHVELVENRFTLVGRTFASPVSAAWQSNIAGSWALVTLRSLLAASNLLARCREIAIRA